MMNIICPYWNFCINKASDKCYKCIYNDYLNEEKEEYKNYLEIEKAEYKEEFDMNEYL